MAGVRIGVLTPGGSHISGSTVTIVGTIFTAATRRDGAPDDPNPGDGVIEFPAPSDVGGPLVISVTATTPKGRTANIIWTDYLWPYQWKNKDIIVPGSDDEGNPLTDWLAWFIGNRPFSEVLVLGTGAVLGLVSVRLWR